jgi:cytochrome c oxidase assembly factor CtaG
MRGQRFVDRLQRTMRGRNAMLNVFELWVALAGVITGLVFFYAPSSIDKGSLAITIGHTLAALWSVSYFTSGLIIWFGLLRPSPRLEIAGLCLLGSATSINGIAILSVFGLRGAATSITLFTLTFASWIRASFVMRASLHLADEHDASSG